MVLTKKVKNVISWVLILSVAAGIYFYRNPNVNFNTDATEGIHFFKGSWAEAMAKAKQENKPIFLDVYATWCGPCKRLKKYVLSNKKVGDYFNTHFVNVSIDAENGEGVTLSNQYGVESYPSLFFINNNGSIKMKHAGLVEVEQLIQLGEVNVNK
jgi:thioredoxin 1